jgi:hypothetical protein
VLEQRARESKTLLLPFVYPGYQSQLRKFRNVVLINHPLRSYREVPPMALADKLALMQEYGQLLLQFDTQFAVVCKHWQARLKDSAGEAFWTGIRDTYAAQTRVLSAHQREARTRLGSGAVHQTGVSTQAKDQSAHASLTKKLRVAIEASRQVTTDVGDEAANTPLLDADGEPLVLPADFDAEFYLVMNPDVLESGMSARAHFLQFGRNEGRVYRV